MTPAAWRALAHKYPGRVVYPSFNPDRPREPWVPVPDNRTWWQRTKPRQAQFTTVQRGWPSDPMPALPPSGQRLGDELVPHRPDAEERRYLERLQNDLIDGRWPIRRGERRYQ